MTDMTICIWDDKTPPSNAAALCGRKDTCMVYRDSQSDCIDCLWVSESRWRGDPEC